MAPLNYPGHKLEHSGPVGLAHWTWSCTCGGFSMVAPAHVLGDASPKARVNHVQHLHALHVAETISPIDLEAPL